MTVTVTVTVRMENSGITLVAIDKDKNSQHAVKWAVDNLIITNKKNSADCILIHVRNQSLHPRRYLSLLLSFHHHGHHHHRHHNDVMIMYDGYMYCIGFFYNGGRGSP